MTIIPPVVSTIVRAAFFTHIPLGGMTAKGSGINASSHYGTFTKAFQAVYRLLAFTEPRPLAKLQPGCVS
jgi:hypothetical protein